MPHITQEPNLAVRPDFSSATYDAVCTALTTPDVTKDEVATCLSDAWDVENNTKKVAWEEQDEVATAEARLAQDELEQHKHDEQRKEEETEKNEKQKKKPKLKDFIANKPVKDTTQLCPSRYAIHKLYLTLPLVFPPESSGLLESHSSPGKVRYSGCSPGGIQWEASGKPVGSQWEASGNPVGIQ
jgi:hypothetical protein